MKILISAFACEPGRGSEPGVGWNFAVEMVRYHEVWVLTLGEHKVAIEAELQRNPVAGLHFVYFDLPRWLGWWRKGERGIRTYYYLWQLGVYKVARDLHRQVGFDLAQHITFVCYWRPSLLGLLPIPFVLGPVGGAESAPRAFQRDFGLRGKIFERARDVARFVGELDPFVRLAARRSFIALATTRETAERLRRIGAGDVRLFGESGLTDAELRQQSVLSGVSSGTVKFASVGRLVPLKGFHLGLSAFARADVHDAEYWFIGDGPERSRLEKLAKDLGVSERVRFWGWLSRDETLELIEQCNVLVHPSLHDSGGWVCIEAMASGCPVICLDLGGPAVQVSDETGFRILASRPQQAIKDMARAMSLLASDSGLLESMGVKARQRVVQDFAWSRKTEKLCSLYEEAISHGNRDSSDETAGRMEREDCGWQTAG